MMDTYKNIDFRENGIVEGVYYGQQERINELNNRIQTRHFPDVALPPNFDPRPVSTRFSLFPVLNIRTKDKTIPTSIIDDETNQKVVYNPGTDRGPPITFLRNINIESDLRKEYIPNTMSDLYINPSNPITKTSKENESLFSSQLGENPNFLLKDYEKYTTQIPNYLANPFENQSSQIYSQKIGENKFNNFTKTQLRNLP